MVEFIRRVSLSYSSFCDAPLYFLVLVYGFFFVLDFVLDFDDFYLMTYAFAI